PKESLDALDRVRRRHAGEPELARDRGDDGGFLRGNTQVGGDGRPVERAVGAEERGVRDEPEAFVDLHRPEAIAADADDRQALALERAARGRQAPAPAHGPRPRAISRASPSASGWRAVKPAPEASHVDEL